MQCGSSLFGFPRIHEHATHRTATRAQLSVGCIYLSPLSIAHGRTQNPRGIGRSPSLHLIKFTARMLTRASDCRHQTRSRTPRQLLAPVGGVSSRASKRPALQTALEQSERSEQSPCGVSQRPAPLISSYLSFTCWVGYKSAGLHSAPCVWRGWGKGGVTHGARELRERHASVTRR